MSLPWHPYRHVLPLDGDVVLWAPDLDGLSLSHAPTLHRTLCELREGAPPTQASAALQTWLGTEGYLAAHVARLPVPEGSPAVLVASAFDPVGWSRALEALEGPLRAFLYTGDGRRALAYAFRPGADPCGGCLVRRWLSAREDSPALRRVVQDRLAPVWTPCAGLSDALHAAWEHPGVAHLLEGGRVRRVRFLPAPGCCPMPERCGPRRWYGHPLGLVKEVVRGAVWTARTGATRPVLGGAAFGSGSGTTRWAAVGEALERYSAAWLPPDLAWEVGEPTFPFTGEQVAQPGFPYRRPRPGERLPWLPVRRVSPGRGGGLVAAEALLLLREGLVPPPDPVPVLSHGIACARSLRGAFTAALLEVLERDATARFWGRLLRGTSDALRLPFAPPAGTEGVLLRLPGLAPTAAVLLRDPQGGWCSGSASRLSLAEAAAKAGDEARHNLAVLQAAPGTDPGDVPGDFAGHLRFYWHRPSAFPEGTVLGLPLGEPSDERVSIPGVLAELRRQSVEVSVRDLTSPDVRAAGFRVVRVSAPGLLGLPAHHLAWPAALSRWIREVGPTGPDLPHPFG